VNYLANYYKNLCEELEEKILSIQQILNEFSEEEDDGSIEEPEQPKSIEDKWIDDTKHIYDEDQAFAIKVPPLRTGKNGNYREWKAANAARNMALKRSRMVGGRGGRRVVRIGDPTTPEKSSTETPKKSIDVNKIGGGIFGTYSNDDSVDLRRKNAGISLYPRSGLGHRKSSGSGFMSSFE
jgi:hypothetical protein